MVSNFIIVSLAAWVMHPRIASPASGSNAPGKCLETRIGSLA